jgi:hypothetical protein
MKTLAFIALISITYFVIGLIILHFLRSDINPVKQATAYYAVGAHRFIMTSVFFSVFVASVALLIGFYQGIMASARSNLGLVLLGLWSAGVLVALCFPINPEGVPMTIPARIHRMSTPAIFLCLTLGNHFYFEIIQARFKLVSDISFSFGFVMAYAGNVYCNFCCRYYKNRVFRSGSKSLACDICNMGYCGSGTHARSSRWRRIKK